MSNPNGLKNGGFLPRDRQLQKFEMLNSVYWQSQIVNISSFAVLGIKLWPENDDDLNRSDPLKSFNFIQLKAQY